MLKELRQKELVKDDDIAFLFNNLIPRRVS